MCDVKTLSRRAGTGARRGFTLIELLLVMVILAILAAVVVPKFVGRGEQARSTAATTDLTTIKGALETFEVDNGRFPTTEEGLTILVTKPGDLPNWRGPYIDKAPVDPWGRPYVYRFPGTGDKKYDLSCTGATGSENIQ